jgi:predicted glycosyltransferase
MGHPGHVHLFKHFIWDMKTRGHEVLITTRDKQIIKDLLRCYGFDSQTIGRVQDGFLSLLLEWTQRDIGIYRIARRFRPDYLIGVGNPSIAHAGALLHKPSIIFTDTEHAKFGNGITFPFARAICTPSCYRDELGAKQVRYDGYHELAYLHPNRFTPNPAVLEELDLTADDRFIIVRFVSWNASHDVGAKGIRDKMGLVKALEPYGRVLITSEGELPAELQPYQISVSPEKLHDLLAFATLYIGEGATIASECSVLGTHAIYVNTLRLGYTDEEEDLYGLVSTFSDVDGTDDDVIARAMELLGKPDLRKEGQEKRERLLRDKIDVTDFMIWFIENYPRSLTGVERKSESRS